MFILITHLFDIVRRNSVLVTHGSLRVKVVKGSISRHCMKKYSLNCVQFSSFAYGDIHL